MQKSAAVSPFGDGAKRRKTAQNGARKSPLKSGIETSVMVNDGKWCQEKRCAHAGLRKMMQNRAVEGQGCPFGNPMHAGNPMQGFDIRVSRDENRHAEPLITPCTGWRSGFWRGPRAASGL